MLTGCLGYCDVILAARARIKYVSDSTDAIIGKYLYRYSILCTWFLVDYRYRITVASIRELSFARLKSLYASIRCLFVIPSW